MFNPRPGAMALTLAAVTAVAAGAAGCGGTSDSDGAAPSATTSVSPPAGPGGGSAAPSPGADGATSVPTSGGGGGGAPGEPGKTDPPAVLARCHTADLKAVVTGYDAGAGQRYARVVFTNVSGKSCRMRGWPGLGLGNQNEGFGTEVVRVGSATTIVVAAGGKAHVKLHWAGLPADDETEGPQCQPSATVIQVIPPDENSPLVATWNGGPVCNHNRLESTAVASGTGA